MASTGFKPSAGWHFPPGVGAKPRNVPGSFTEDSQPPRPEPAHPTESQDSSSKSHTEPRERKPRTHWPPRTCRICFETVLPTFTTASESLPSVLQPQPHVSYTSADPELGRLLRPCKCKGTSKYVHEGCLQAWRHADPGYAKRNYWQCPTCQYKYRLERLTWAARISNTFTQLLLTGLIFLLALFLMGFIADPIINVYAEPTALLWSPRSIGQKIEPLLSDEDIPTWGEHFFKGLMSLGLLGFVKVLIGMSPWNWLNVRFGGSSRTGNTGRDRAAQISWIVVVIGVCTFLWVSQSTTNYLCSKTNFVWQAVYKGVRAWSRRTLEKASERVLDIPVDNDDDEEEEPTNAI
ncbi:uncharacterized protein KY384_004401 [Bacidia gigantensis]|uniref:uncharacterized protein n=1 Tax=Bacidia gigantensis TaxID=2732470 RepID=UPI001D03F0C9|nr:uncharacterized protein KY384_004401 [Bacidia gigantensis]KAG8531044.1 hypothetical protein KY384_004401 [Bacidia gigantensis]